MTTMPPMQEFCIKLSMSNIMGRPLSVTLTRFDEYNTPLIGCSQGFLKLAGRPRSDVIGRNLRFLNQGLDMPTSTRERLHHTIRAGTPFLGVLKNKRYLGSGCSETFDNLLHMVVVFAGDRSYILGLHVNVTGLNLNVADGSQDAVWLQLMFDSVLCSGTDSWIHAQEGEFQAPPLYLYIRYAGDSNDQVEIQGEEHQGSQCIKPDPFADQHLVLAPQFSPLDQLQDKPKPARWADEPWGGEECSPSRSRTDSLRHRELQSRTPSPPRHRELQYQRELQYKGRAQREETATESPGSGNESPYKTTSFGTTESSRLTKGRISNASDHDTSSISPLPLSKFWQAAPEYANPVECQAALANKDIEVPTMKTQLRALELEDPDAVIIARNISKLGLSSGETLRHHFANFGLVKAVHIPYTFKKQKRSNLANADGSGREIRAPGRGFIVMSTPEERNKILAESKEHLVHGVKVTLEIFNAKPDVATDGALQ